MTQSNGHCINTLGSKVSIHDPQKALTFWPTVIMLMNDNTFSPLNNRNLKFLP